MAARAILLLDKILSSVELTVELLLQQDQISIMGEIPTAADLARDLSTIVQEAHQKARAESVRLKSEFAAHGAARSVRLIIAVAGRVDIIHKEALAESMRVVIDFTRRMQIDTMEITLLARPYLENLASAMLAEIPAAGHGAEQLRFRTQYAQIFELRLDRALHDVETGFPGQATQT